MDMFHQQILEEERRGAECADPQPDNSYTEVISSPSTRVHAQYILFMYSAIQ